MSIKFTIALDAIGPGYTFLIFPKFNLFFFQHNHYNFSVEKLGFIICFQIKVKIKKIKKYL